MVNCLVVEFTPSGEYYKPIIYFNDYWNLVKDYQPFNSSVKYVARPMLVGVQMSLS